MPNSNSALSIAYNAPCEVIRPIILLGEHGGPAGRGDPAAHLQTVRDLTRRFRQQGMLGLLPEHTEIVTPSRGKGVSEKCWRNWRA